MTYFLAKNKKLILLAAIVIAVIAGRKIVKEVSSYEEASSTYSALEEMVVTVSEPEEVSQAVEVSESVDAAENKKAAEEEESSVCQLTEDEIPAMDIDFDALKDVNSDTIAWIYIPAANISYPVMQTSDNETYLSVAADGSASKAGSVYVNAGCSADFSDNNTFIHAHNMADGSMFGKLDESFYWNDASDKNIYVFLADGTVYRYEVTYVYTVSDDSDMFRYTTSDRAYEAYLEEARELADSEIAVESSNKMITLATCYGLHSGQKLLVNAVMTGEAH